MGRTGIILDLDDTLVDTQELRDLRQQRSWKSAVQALDRTAVFPGVRELLEALAARGIPWAIVTTSVSYYATAVLRHHGLGSPPLVAYHDATPKPNPRCIAKALQRMNLEPAQVLGLGDHANDHAAYSAAGVLSLGAGWSPVLQDAAWHSVVATPMEVLEYC
jgi:HAD superfamily hydrolase (TIGR01509 family)